MSPWPAEVCAQAEAVLDAARAQGLHVATAESCTGGLVAAALTSIAGSSDVVEAGLVTYSNAAKTALLGVSPDLLLTHGAVSEPIARAMAQGALERTGADLAVAVTGIAGPGGGSPDKPVGLVWLATARGGETFAKEERFGELGRDEVRAAAVRTALSMLMDSLR
jgi:nicotinamide-nucleotide amidase